MSQPETGISLRLPSAYLPLLMSIFALAMIVFYVVIYGVSNEPAADEGAAARLFQLVMLSELPIVGYFVIRRLPRAPIPGLAILALQILGWVTPVALILYLEL